MKKKTQMPHRDRNRSTFSADEEVWRLIRRYAVLNDRNPHNLIDEILWDFLDQNAEVPGFDSEAKKEALL